MNKKIVFSVAIFFICFLTKNNPLFAQKVEFDKKTEQIKVDGAVVGKILTLSGGAFSESNTYSLKDLQDKEVVLVKMNRVESGAFYDYLTEYNFVASGQKAYTKANDRKSLAKELVKYGVLSKTGFSVEGEKRMAILHKDQPKYDFPVNLGGIISNNPTPNKEDNANNPYTFKQLERNRQDNIMVFGDLVQQNFKDLGKITNMPNAINGKVMVVYKAFNHENLEIAMGLCELNGNSMTVTSYKDKSEQRINILTGESDIKKSLAEYLVRGFYW